MILILVFPVCRQGDVCEDPSKYPIRWMLATSIVPTLIEALGSGRPVRLGVGGGEGGGVTSVPPVADAA